MWQIKPSNLALYIHSQLSAKPQHSVEMYCTQLGSLLSFAELHEHFVNGARERSQHGNAYKPFGSGQTLWDRTPLNLAVTMGLCDCLNVLFSEWCGSLGSDNGFTLHHLFPESLRVTRPLLFAPFWTNCAASTHLQQFWIWDLFVLLSATLKWKWLAFACNMSSYCLFGSQV